MTITLSGLTSHSVQLTFQVHVTVRTPKVLLLSVWPFPLSLATTRRISFDFSSSAYLDVSVQRVPLHPLWIHAWITGSSPAWFPNSEICGSKLICSSPQLIAACHVLLRRLVPRHPPCALSCLTFASILPDTLSLIMSLQRFSLAVCPLLSFFELSGIFLCSYHFG